MKNLLLVLVLMTSTTFLKASSSESLNYVEIVKEAGLPNYGSTLVCGAFQASFWSVETDWLKGHAICTSFTGKIYKLTLQVEDGRFWMDQFGAELGLELGVLYFYSPVRKSFAVKHCYSGFRFSGAYLLGASLNGMSEYACDKKAKATFKKGGWLFSLSGVLGASGYFSHHNLMLEQITY